MRGRVIYWDVSPDIFSIGPVTIRWYGLLFAASFIVGYQLMMVIFNKEGRSEKDLNDLVWYMVIGTVAGARLGHCLFYSPEYYLSHPLEILMVWKGGLASHGAAIAIPLSLYLYIRSRKGFTFLWIMDRVVITVALSGFFIRMGNLFNSEIFGKPTDVPWAFVFSIVDGQPRHPTQIYEALAYLMIFILLLVMYLRSQGKIREGKLFGIFLILVFGFRFFVEFIKENQSQFEEGLILNMGQLLSIPLVLMGIYILTVKEKKTIKLQ
ncbi:MAG: prolipoprotein diacylglyceryl transferase [Stygiobacter sp. RIFOXYC12_FULL_38_8]|nr:MAG: prolipoprotein diacylglyceryl transferase [Stygiobacter sp. GWC2_38_9]OGU85273.1 MAG: prolipoprotein diacylglyceryl transferase [Stygiobacter sp. RIFOXYA12_FULL_38_9]OGV05911.1 MAG: prolipoprotein diacylglyceryl transferase [Stygiobacter sp. RIFOXYB2_FULL_37_11]OGV10676.1 MAG: prolipoprotein diacylglyceryl transferase [Stygiobacter sp. RIFOXYA2_FULL_38_8]OGV14502.1 MAG: prolipoprotein diacylglyceryl transferase [Stygiobacter sp. RIFOXYC2_FULL_38_25]OGV28903.1 MAG: prolipoprotein diacyl